MREGEREGGREGGRKEEREEGKGREREEEEGREGRRMPSSAWFCQNASHMLNINCVFTFASKF